MNGQALAKWSPPPDALAVHPDTERYKGRFDIRSESSERVYRVSFDCAAGARWWVCSCPGNVAHGDCKHLRAMGLQGRRFGSNLAEGRKHGFIT